MVCGAEQSVASLRWGANNTSCICSDTNFDTCDAQVLLNVMTLFIYLKHLIHHVLMDWLIVEESCHFSPYWPIFVSLSFEFTLQRLPLYKTDIELFTFNLDLDLDACRNEELLKNGTVPSAKKTQFSVYNHAHQWLYLLEIVIHYPCHYYACPTLDYIDLSWVLFEMIILCQCTNSHFPVFA